MSDSPPTTPDHAAPARAALSASASATVHRPLILAWSRAHGLSEHDAADVAQEVSVRILAHATAFPNLPAQVAWLRTVTSNLCIDALRRGRRSPKALAFELAAVDPAPRLRIADDERDRVACAMQDLSEHQRLVLVAKITEGRTFAEIAADLGIGVPTAKTHYQRAIESLRAKLHPLAPERSPSHV